MIIYYKHYLAEYSFWLKYLFQMNILQIENNLLNLIKDFNKETFIYDLLSAYNLPNASISRLPNKLENYLINIKKK